MDNGDKTESVNRLANCSLPGSSVHGILQGRIVEWVAIPFSRGSSQSMDQAQVSCIAGGFFTIWATREVILSLQIYYINNINLGKL